MRLLASTALLVAMTACVHRPHTGPEGAGQQQVAFRSGSTFELNYDALDEPVAEQVARAVRAARPLAERWGPLPAVLTITIHPTHDALEAAAGGARRPWLRGWARRDRIDLQSPRTWSDGYATDTQLFQLLAHELTHCALHAALGDDATTGRSVPSWFWEGMATTNAGERFDVAEWTPRTLRQDAPVTRVGQPPAYAAANRAFRHLAETQGRERIRQVLAAVRRGATFPVAFQDVLGLRLAEFEAAFGLDGGGHARG